MQTRVFVIIRVRVCYHMSLRTRSLFFFPYTAPSFSPISNAINEHSVSDRPLNPSPFFFSTDGYISEEGGGGDVYIFIQFVTVKIMVGEYEEGRRLEAEYVGDVSMKTGGRSSIS